MPNRRQHIIDRAAEVVHRKGFHSTTIDDVLAAAGVGKGNFYHYFRSKDELGLAIIENIGKTLQAPEIEEMFSHDRQPLERLRAYADHVYARRTEVNHGDPLANLAAELGNVEPFRDRLRRVQSHNLGRLEATIAELALENGVEVDARMLAMAYAAQLDGLCVQFKVTGDAPALRAGLDHAVDTVRAYVAAARQEAAPTTARTQPISAPQ